MSRHTERAHWQPGNDFTLLENGEAFFPAVFEAIAQATHEVILETFILFEDKVGLALHQVLVEAARRGLQVDLLVDGFGSPDLSERFIGELTAAGVRLRVFDPQKPLFGIRANVLRRMHRKIVVVDGELAFVGGINYSADHLLDFGPEAKQDYSVRVRGPVVADIHRFVRAAIKEPHGPRRWWFQRRPAPPRSAQPHAGTAHALFVTRDNHDHRDDIERLYRVAIRSAKKRVWIANAYFFPGYRLLRELRRAARRGVDVRLILQGTPDMPIVKFGAELLHDHLLRAGVKIYEYCQRPFHGKVALADDEWATVGSSNLDPLSLALNLEANVVIRDRAFNQQLAERLDKLVCESCREVAAEGDGKPTAWQVVRSFVVFHVLRRFPYWASWLPRHTPALVNAHGDEPAKPPQVHHGL
ncbi:cardiolipin synthase ClsB [Rhizobacter sp. J219]|uniref:cardiolipin synthase ClsB n=1 Tax=Rhizobacter sp. J219 TaxID=2898430 RepID=UPI0021507DAF|nr:cardiolipin synthase ClsB [Rhizobacter sp. J219]MCR5884537.1 cardiolipin synthase ClsB [Rhizobacter sp. J219]